MPSSAERIMIRELTSSMYSNSDVDDLGSGIIGTFLTFMSWVVVALTFPFSLFFCFKVVQEYERAVIFRLGRLQSGGSRGIFFVLPCIESYSKVDLRTSCFDVPPQEVLTKDSVTVSVDAVVYYRVSNAIVSIANVANAHQSTRLLAQTTLRNILGTKNLHELLSEREIISNAIQSSLDVATEAWGIKVERVEIKDVRLPVQLQRAMAAEAEASREARAKVIAAEGEQKASRALKEASDVISESPAALQLRYLQVGVRVFSEIFSTMLEMRTRRNQRRKLVRKKKLVVSHLMSSSPIAKVSSTFSMFCKFVKYHYRIPRSIKMYRDIEHNLCGEELDDSFPSTYRFDSGIYEQMEQGVRIKKAICSGKKAKTYFQNEIPQVDTDEVLIKL